MEITPINSAAPVSSSKPVAVANASVESPPPLQVVDARLDQEIAELHGKPREDTPQNLEHFTLQYETKGMEILIKIIDEEGRVVRSIPPQELMETLQSQNLGRRFLEVRG